MKRRLAIITALGTVSVLVALPGGAAAKLRADYQFEGNFRSSAGSVSKLAKVGPGGEFKKQRVGRKRQGVWKWPEGSGLRLVNANKAVGANGGTYTFVMLVNLDVVESYRKLIDFKDLEVEDGLYVDDGALDPYPLDESASVISAGRWTQIVMTRSNTNVVRGYVNGRRVLTVEDTEGAEVLGAERILHFLMDDEVTGGEETGGRIARLRIWDNPLGKRKIRNLGR